MSFAGINYLAVCVAALAGFGFGFAWYAFLAKRWLAALGKPRKELLPAGGHPVDAIVINAVAQLVMAWMLGGLLGHLGSVDIKTGAISGVSLWVGFVATVIVVNYRYQRAGWTLCFIDAGHWLGVLVIQGVILGAFGI